MGDCFRVDEDVEPRDVLDDVTRPCSVIRLVDQAEPDAALVAVVVADDGNPANEIQLTL